MLCISAPTLQGGFNRPRRPNKTFKRSREGLSRFNGRKPQRVLGRELGSAEGGLFLGGQKIRTKCATLIGWAQLDVPYIIILLFLLRFAYSLCHIGREGQRGGREAERGAKRLAECLRPPLCEGWIFLGREK